MVRGRKKLYERVENTSINILDPVKDIAQVETYNLLLDEYKTPLEIAQIRKVNISAVYKSLDKLKKKGLIKGVEKSSYIRGGKYSDSPKSEEKYRTHAIDFTIEILESKEYYLNLLKTKNKHFVDNCTVLMGKDNLTVYIVKDFNDNNPNDSIRKAMLYLPRLITILENEFKIILVKGRRCNIRTFRGEIARKGDDIARRFRLSKEKLKVYDDKGVLRVISDFSFKYDELECVSEDNFREDSIIIHDFIKDLVTKETVKLSEAREHIAILQKTDNLINDKIQQVLDMQNTTALELQALTQIVKKLIEK